MRKAVFGILVGIIVIGVALSVEKYFRLQAPIHLGNKTDSKALPAVTLKRFDDKKDISLGSFKGKVVLINFWASWCSSCIVEMPSINRLYDLLKDKGFDVIAVNVDEKPENVVPALVKKLDLHFPVYLDQANTLTQFFDVVAIPFSVVVGKNQQVLWAESGERDWAAPAIVDEIEKALKAP